MEIILKRKCLKISYTIGVMYINGERFCDTLENRRRDLTKEPKIQGETAIPEGAYRIVLAMSPRFGRELPRLLNVPFFDGILIHRGNTVADTAGCVLVGENREKGKVLNSTPYELRLVDLCRKAILRGEEITITIELA